MQRSRPWSIYAEHRKEVNAAIAAATGPDDESIALVGIGRAHDTDLAALNRRFPTVALVDIDRNAVLQGLAGQQQSPSDFLLIAPFDVTGLDDMPLWGDAAGDLWLERVASPPVLPGGPYDGIVSLCLLSQLMHAMAERFGDQHPRYEQFLQAMRAAHLRFLIQAVKPGGWAVLLWDVVASDTLPAMLNGPFTRRTVERMAREAIAARNYFSGLPPPLVRSTCDTDEWLQAQHVTYTIDRPWVWQDDVAHARIVYAMTLRRGKGG